jgi:hypothetical protein
MNSQLSQPSTARTPRRRKWLKRTVIVVLLALCISPCVFCLWLFWWPDFSIHMSFRLYPGAQEVSSAYGYYGAGSGLQFLYFWTEDPIDSVQRYYEDFTFPFINNDGHGGEITVFSPYGSELIYHSVDGSQHEIDYSREPQCHYTQIYDCINVRLIGVEYGWRGDLPRFVWPPSYTNVQTPVPVDIVSSTGVGTLIVYSYFRSAG